jgi:hypothetical protein
MKRSLEALIKALRRKNSDCIFIEPNGTKVYYSMSSEDPKLTFENDPYCFLQFCGSYVLRTKGTRLDKDEFLETLELCLFDYSNNETIITNFINWIEKMGITFSTVQKFSSLTMRDGFFYNNKNIKQILDETFELRIK